MRTTSIVLLVVATACSDIPPTNPFDPSTPPNQQQAGSIGGTLLLPDGFDPVALAQGSAALWQLSEPGTDEAVQRVTLAPDGTFVLEDVVSGAYAVRVEVPGFLTQTVVVEVGIGEHATLPPMTLVPETEGAGAVVGTAELAGAGASSHGGIRVSAVNTPWDTETEDDGRFRLVLPPGHYDLKLARSGYASVVESGIRVKTEEQTTIPGRIVLVGEPAALRGTVALGGDLAGPDWFGNVRVTLMPVGSEDGPPAQTVRIDEADGFFLFSSVAAGEWRFEASRAGFVTATLRVRLTPGETRDLGLVTLLSDDEITGRVEGEARLEGAGQPGQPRPGPTARTR